MMVGDELKALIESEGNGAGTVSSDGLVVDYVIRTGAGIPLLTEMQTQKNNARPMVVCANGDWFQFGDNLLDEPLIGREYRFGVYDCYEAIRAWFWQERDQYLSAFPREPEDGFGLYEQFYEQEGFVEANSIEIGDVLFFALIGGNLNHAGVYLGGNEIFHHRAAAPSCISKLRKPAVAKIIRSA